MKLSFKHFSLTVVLMTSIASAQVATGTPPFGSFGGGPFDIVNLGNLNVHFAVPVLHKAGRGMPFIYNLSYDSSIWTPVSSNGVYQWQPAQNWGWVGRTAVASGYVYAGTVGSASGCGSSSGFYLSNFVYLDSSGVSHPFAGTMSECVSGGPGGPTCYNQTTLSNVLASDGSGYTLTTSWSGCGSAGDVSPTVVSKGGTTYTPPFNVGTGPATKTDTNGNQISVNSSGQFFDTLSGTTPVLTVANIGTPTTSTTLRYTAPNGTATYTVNYTQYTVATNFGVKTNSGSTISEYGRLSNPLVSSVQLPDGSSYTFSYEQTPGSCTPLSGTSECVTGRIISIGLPTTGSITYTYTGGPNNTGIYSDGGTAGLTRMLSPTPTCSPTQPTGCWAYTRALQSGSPGPNSTWTTTVVDPNANNTVINFAEDGAAYSTYDFYETQRKVYQGSVSNSGCSASITNNCLLTTKIVCYNRNYANCSTATVSSSIGQTDTYTQLPNGSAPRLSEVVGPDGYGGWFTDDKEYNYGVTLGATPSSTYLVRETAITFDTNLIGITDKPSAVTVYDWSSGSQVTLASTTYQYDQGTPTPTTGTPQHVAPCQRCSRGNITTLTRSTSSSASITKTLTYYDTGNRCVVTDVNAAQATYSYGSTTSCGNSFPTSIAGPIGTVNYTWNCTGGVMKSVEDANGKTTTIDYATNPNFWWPDYILDPVGNETTFNYTLQTAVKSTLSFNGGNSVSDLLTTVDAFGRPALSQRAQTPSLTEYDSVASCYNNMGQVYFTSMPYQATSGSISCASPGTTTTYDALGRPLTVTDGGGGTVSYVYINNDVLQTVGPTQNFQKQLEYDGLGRLSSVCEITSATGSGTCGQSNSQTGYWTKYTYDALGNMLTVTQNAQAAAGSRQSRSFTYDMLSRLKLETNPETGPVNYTYDVACGSYSASAGDLTKRVDNAGNTTCYAYDGGHRLTDSGNSGPTCRHFRYGSQTAPSGVSISWMAPARLTEAYTDACSGSKLTDEWFGYDADGNVLQFYESTPHSGGYYQTKATYWANGAIDSLSALNPSSNAIFPTIYYGTSTGAGLDGEGRVTQVSAASGTNPVVSPGVTYNNSSTTEPIGALTGVTYGATVSGNDSDSFTYYTTTRRPHTYSFSVNGAADTGTLTWNSNGTLKTLAIADSLPSATDTQNCNYFYDALGRLGGKSANNYSADCGSGKWQQLFTFDAFGNISMSGSASFLPTYQSSPPTNQFSAIPGVTGPYYDGNGNLTKDNLNSYTWDPNWGNPASINTTNLIYDAQGQMVEQHNGSTYTQLLYGQGGKTAIMNGQTLIKAFVYLPGGGTAIYTAAGLAYYRHADWLGSSRLTSTPARTVYSVTAYAPYGQTYDVSGTPDPSFTGQNQDTTSSLYDFTFREHSWSQGRWVSPDPSGLAAVDPTNPQSWNRYAYVANNPLSNVDPLGLDCAYADACNMAYTYGFDACLNLDCWDSGYFPTMANLPYPEYPCLSGCPTIAPAKGILPGQDCLNCYPVGASVLQILQAILSGNIGGALQDVGVIPADAINCESGICQVNPVMDATPPGVPSPSDLLRRDYEAFQQCVGNPWSPAQPLPTWTSFVPTKLNPWASYRQGSGDFGSNGPGMGPTGSPLPQAPINMPQQDFNYKKVSDCMKAHSLAPLGGNVYMDPGDVF